MIWQPLHRFGGVIDVSHHNGRVDWPGVGAAGIALAFLKATQGDAYQDPTFNTNREGAIAAGIMVVPYHFLTEAAVDRQIANLGRVAGFALPVMVDWEEDPAVGRRPPVATMEEFCARLRDAGKRNPLAYHGMYDLSSPTINALPWMVPKYGPQPHGPRWLFWQDTSKADIPGVPSAGEDHSWFAGTLDEMRLWWRDGTLPAGFDAVVASPVASYTINDAWLAFSAATRTLQAALTAGGFDSGPDDGLFGRRTAAALETWKATL